MKDFIDLLKIPPRILGALTIASGLLLFLPDVLLSKLYMIYFRNKYGFALGITFVYDIVMENELPDYLQYDFGLTK